MNGPVPNPLYGTGAQPKENPGTPTPSVATNAFHDTMLVNGTAYPYLPVERKAYRLRILNACGDRQLNLQLYYAISDQVTRTGADGAPELQTESGDVSMLPAQPPMKGGWPARWPTDTRRGGVPDPRAVGPAMIQIGNDGGLLPQAATVRPTPVGLEHRFPTDQEASMGEYPSIIAVGTKALYLAPGERADVVVDFSRVPAGSKLILYNDAPAPAPNADSRVDYYTGDGDQTAIGGAPETVAGYGPNTRTIMQFQVDGPAAAPFDLERLRRALPAAYVAAQDPVLVPTEAYRDAYGTALGPAAAPEEEAQDEAVPVVPQEESGTLTFTPLGRGYRLTLPAQGKMVSDLFDPTYGRLTATLGVDAPLSANGVRTAVPYSAIDPATEYLGLQQEATAPQLGDATQIWRVTHDGTTSHSVAFGGFDVQVLSRARREGEARAPDPGELGWKDTLRVDPLESVLIAVRPVAAAAPVQAAGQRAIAGHHAAARRPGRVHATGPGQRAAGAARGRQCAGGPQLRGLLEHPPHGRAGEPHRPPARAPGDAPSPRRVDRDRRRRRPGQAGLDGAAVPAARRRLRGGAGNGRGLRRGPPDLPDGRRRGGVH